MSTKTKKSVKKKRSFFAYVVLIKRLSENKL